MTSIRKDKKRGTWMFVTEGPPKPGAVDGNGKPKRSQLSRSGFPTKKAAEDAAAELAVELSSGRFTPTSEQTVAQYLESWLDGRVADLKPTTVVGYRKDVARLVRGIGHVRLTDLDAMMLQNFFRSMLHDGGVNGGAVGPKTIANTAGTLKKALADAVRLRVLPHNVARDAELPRRAKTKATAWTGEEAAAFLNASVDDREYVMWRLVLSTGMRRGELCGLRWSDLDLDGATMTVTNTRLVVDGGQVIDSSPKSEASDRVVSLDDDTVTALRSWRARLAAERLAAGADWLGIEDDYVLVSPLGIPPHPEAVTKWWRAAVKRSGVRSIRLHDARHSAASIMLRSGVPLKMVSERLGHADTNVTLRVYAHVTQEDDRKAADALGAVLSGR